MLPLKDNAGDEPTPATSKTENQQGLIGVGSIGLVMALEGEAPVTAFNRKTKEKQTYAFDECPEEIDALREQAEAIEDAEDLLDTPEDLKKELIDNGLLEAFMWEG